MTIFEEERYDKITTHCMYIRSWAEDIQLKLADYRARHNKLPEEAEQILRLLKESYEKLDEAYGIVFDKKKE